MITDASEIAWLQKLLKQLQIGHTQGTKFIYDNQVIFHIASNSVFHERTKHIKIDYHFVREKVLSGEITIEFVHFNNQLADVFIKSLKGHQVNYICNKLSAYDIYAPA
uniref:Copia protein n=1 Tax=Cajanus cajan TaxID=3821 RepID=A0A151TXB5_CAJCA|nr:Copia protein [Cajanus cajan]